MPKRLDQALFDLGLAPSRARAQALIKDGVVLLNGKPAAKPGLKVPEDAQIELTGNPNPYVSRAALKLAGALDAFGLQPSGIALDVGASTGGFTQVLLERGVSHVYALDVGHNQLHPKLANDPRVSNLEGINARNIPDGLIPMVDWVVTDVSFISLTKALAAALDLAKPDATLVALIKPQFEAGRADVGKGGIVKDPKVHARVCAEIRTWLEQIGWQVSHEGDSPIEGSDGNREFLIAARKL